ncbi:MAG TPA: TetR/AcrR family transcriptional regulator [Thermodesulfobacteriota bacterium]|nr:TetR/AcrR family transcriptional regulator [Thermodesulfobacteriota bacterium]
MTKTRTKKIKIKPGYHSKPSFQDRKEEICSKAAMLFAQKGYLSTSMNNIAEEMNLKKAGLYHYLKNKEMLLFEIMNRTLDTFLERARNLPLDGLSPEEKLHQLIREYTTTLVRYCNEVALMLLDSKYLQPKLRKTIYAKRIKYEKLFWSIIEEGISKKIFVKHDGKETLSFLIIGAIFNYYLWHPSELGKDVEKKIDSFSKFFLNGLLIR